MKVHMQNGSTIAFRDGPSGDPLRGAGFRFRSDTLYVTDPEQSKRQSVQFCKWCGALVDGEICVWRTAFSSPVQREFHEARK